MTETECRYEFDPAEWEADDHDRPSTVTGVWSCTRETVDDTDWCPFHLDPTECERRGIDGETLREQLLVELEAEDTDAVTLIEASLGELDLSYSAIDADTNKPIDLRHATIEGGLDASHAVIRQPIRLDEATIRGPVDLSDATLSHHIDLQGVRFCGPVRMPTVTFAARTEFSHARFEDTVSFVRARFADEVDWYRTTFEDEVVFDDFTCVGETSFRRAQFRGATDFMHATFENRADFRGVTFDRDVQVRFSGTTFSREAFFLRGEFGGDSLFKNAWFGGTAYFQNTHFHGETSFSGAVLEGGAKFRFATFGAEASISYAEFGDDTYFPDVDFEGYCSFYESSFLRDADFRGATYEDTARYRDVSFGRKTYFNGSRFRGVADFRGVDFGTQVQFVEPTFEDEVTMAGCAMRNGHLRRLSLDPDSPLVDLRSSRIEGGTISQGGGDDVYYDLERGVLGDVDLDFAGDEKAFDRFRIYLTSFEDFDFSEYRYELSPDWTVHHFDGPDGGADEGTAATSARSNEPGDNGSGTERSRLYDAPLVGALLEWSDCPDSERLETTYLKAKNGATAVGDNRAASEFFIHEMRNRRHNLRTKALDSSETPGTRLKSVVQWLLNHFLWLTCGYGEKAHRTLLLSLGIVFVWGILFAWLLPEPAYGTWWGNFLLSIESFTTLVMGGAASITDPVVRLVVGIEGFFGAFLIALFVFALTRSVHR